ncbi:MAG TPA: DUF4388 domain-containing protein [Anaeromyxobacteraceae bacterium]|nr:DUF4388 domain-containing protein [Anaeromyxobacteraceae bacterium]
MEEHIDIDPHGRLVPKDDQARRFLADRAGHFLLMPSTPDLLLARRAPTSGGLVARPRCVVAGDLSAFPIADFIGFVHQSRMSGVLTVSAVGIDRILCFVSGEVRATSSEGPGERIGDVANRLGYVTEEQQAEGAVAAAETEKRFGRALVDKGFISPGDLWKCLHEQVTCVFHAVLLLREGVFSMEDADLEPGTPLAVNTQSLLLDGIRRIDEMSLFRARIPGPRAYPQRRTPKVPVTLKPLEQGILDLVDGRRSVADIARCVHRSEFDTTKILYHLAEAGHLIAMAEPSATSAPSIAERADAIVAGMNEVLRRIADAINAAGALDPFLAGMRAFLGDPASSCAPLWKMVLPERDGTLPRTTLLGNLATLKGAALAKLEPSSDAARFLFDCLRDLMFFCLFQTSGRLSREDDERLSREVKRRFQALEDLR